MKKLFSLFLVLAASTGTMYANYVSNVHVGELYYWIDLDDKTAEVTNRIPAGGGTYRYSGNIVIPSSITYENQTYNVTEIGSYAFQDCTGLTSITIPNSVTSIGLGVFWDCTGLTSVTIPNNVTSIGNSAFYNCTGLTSVTIGNSVTSIGEGAFQDCTGLTSLSIGNGLTYVGDYAFYNCSSLQTIIINSNTILTKSGSLKNIFGQQVLEYIIGDDVTSIGHHAFQDCTGLTSITIPNSVTSIGSQAFQDCTGLTSVTIPNSVTSIGGSAFYNCNKLTSLMIPNSVTDIGNYAFANCSGLTSVTIGNSVTSIGSQAFEDCTGLTSINVASDNLNYCSEDGILFNKDKSILIQYPASKNNTEYDIPNSVTSIGVGAFSGCSGLTSVTIPNSVTSIGDLAFYSCKGLTSIAIPNSVTSIGIIAFSGCSGLTSVTCMATTPPSMSYEVFYEVDCSQIPLYVPVGSIDAYQTADQWKEFTNILPIAAKETETNTVKTEPTTNSVEVTWPVVAGAYTYELVIKDKSGNIVCTLVFNAQGQLISIAFNAPSRDGAPQQTQGAGFSFTITGLTAGTSYDVTITAKDSNGNTLDTRTSSFTTKGEAPQGIDDINAATKSQKIVRDNQVLILRGDKMYTVTGQEVK